jgi:Tfp pilus assembly protein PilO
MKNFSNKNLSFMPNINKKVSYGILVVAVLMIVLVDYFLIMRLQLKALKTLASQSVALRKNIKETENNIERFSVFENEVDQLKENFEKAKKRAILPEQVPFVLENISRMAREQSVQIDQLMPVKESQSQILKTDEMVYFVLPVLIRGQGGYHAIGHFFNGMERESIFMDIKDFEIIQNPMNPRMHTLRAMVNVVIKEKANK